MAKEGSKNQKKIQKKYSKDGKKNLGTSGTIFAQNRFWGSGGGGGGSDPRSLPLWASKKNEFRARLYEVLKASLNPFLDFRMVKTYLNRPKLTQ